MENQSFDAILDGECTLRHGLNDDCLRKIFEHTSQRELFILSKMDAHFSFLIVTSVVSKKVIDLGMLEETSSTSVPEPEYSTIALLQKFGMYLRKLIIRGTDFNLLLKTIMKYCRPDRLTDVTFECNSNNAYSATTIIHQSMPFFSNLRKLSLIDLNSIGIYRNFLAHLAIGSPARTLEILHLNLVDIDGWLQYMRNIRELHIHSATLISGDDLINFFRANPKLTNFEYRGLTNIESVFATLSKSCPHLKTFKDCQTSNGLMFNPSVSKRYDSLLSLTQLDNVTVSSYTVDGFELRYLKENTASLHNCKFEILTNVHRQIAAMEDDLQITTKKLKYLKDSVYSFKLE